MKAIILTVIFSVAFATAAFGQEMMMKKQEPTMKGTPMMKSVPMMKTTAKRAVKKRKKPAMLKKKKVGKRPMNRK